MYTLTLISKDEGGIFLGVTFVLWIWSRHHWAYLAMVVSSRRFLRKKLLKYWKRKLKYRLWMFKLENATKLFLIIELYYLNNIVNIHIHDIYIYINKYYLHPQQHFIFWYFYYQYYSIFFLISLLYISYTVDLVPSINI